jgi:hypothetical protein
VWRLLLALLVGAVPAWGQPTFSSSSVCVQDDGTLIGKMPCVNFGSGITCSLDAANGRVNCTGSGGGGSSGPSLLGMAACTPITGSVTVYMSPGSCVDTTESATIMPLQDAATFDSLSCLLSDTTGSQTVTITARSGTCGGSMSDSSFVCTISAGGTACDTGAGSLVLSAGECFTFRVSATGAFSSPRSLSCSLVRSG